MAVRDLDRWGMAIDALSVIDPAEIATWPDEDVDELNDLLERLEELSGGYRPPPLPWPTSDPDHLLRTIAPNYATARMVEHHLEWWRWVYAIEPGVAPQPFVGIWARGLAKTSSVQLGVAALGATRRRRYCLYVSRTQRKGDAKMADFTNILTNPFFAERYPDMARVKEIPMVTSSGRSTRRSAEWSRLRLRTAAGFSIEAIGLDVAARGTKLDEQRPDIIVFDDLDEPGDKPGFVAGMIDTLTASIMPAGAPDVAIVYINNLVHDGSIASHIAFPENFPTGERLLLDRHLSGPVPALINPTFAYDPVDAGGGRPGYRITGGEPVWPQHLGLEALQAALNRSNLHAFLREYQHETQPDGGVFSHVEFRYADLSEVPWGRMLTVQVWVDPATSDTDRSDSMGVSCAGIDMDGNVWVLYSWEQVTTPGDALRRAIRVAYQYGASVLGVETDTGGDAWQSVFKLALLEVKENAAKGIDLDGVLIPEDWQIKYASAKAGQTNKSKEERIKMLLTPFEQQRIILVRGTHHVLEKGLRRFPGKPLDSIDAFWWNWSKLVEAASKHKPRSATKARVQRPQYRPRGRR